MRTFDVDRVGHFDPPPNAAPCLVTQRRKLRGLRWPMQRKYQPFTRQ